MLYKNRFTYNFIQLVIFVLLSVSNLAYAGSLNSDWTVWGWHGNQKFWKSNFNQFKQQKTVDIAAASNEWESFQVGIVSHKTISNVKIIVSDLHDQYGNKISKPVVYREHYYRIDKTHNIKYGQLGLVPDALVPLIHPVTNEPTAGKYGGLSVSMQKGDLESFWFDLHINASTKPGIYTGNVVVTADNVEPVTVPVKLEVFKFTLPVKKALTTCFQTSESSIFRMHGLKKNDAQQLPLLYEQVLHDNYIDNWSPVTGWGYGDNKIKVDIVGDDVVVDWSEYDKLVEPYLNGTAYKDKRPSQCLFAPYWMPLDMPDGSIRIGQALEQNYRNINHKLLGKYFRELEKHFAEKGWLDRALLFYFDEPFISNWKYEAFISISKLAKENAPNMRIMVTDGYQLPGASNKFRHDALVKYVDVWDPVTYQVSSPEILKYYQLRKEAGKFDMWCQTLANANPRRGVINLFPEFNMPFHRMWGVMSWRFGFQAIEWWETTYFRTRKKDKDPWVSPVAFPGYKQPLNGDGRFLYPGTGDDIGGPDIPVVSLRVKGVREAVEDFEYLSILEKLVGSEEMEKILEAFHTTEKETSGKMISPMPMGKGPWQWWEGDADQFMKLRYRLAKKIESLM